jgi:hypothetical protein
MMLKPVHRWSCPNCKTTSISHEGVPKQRWHTCPGLSGLQAPMILEGVRAQVRAVEREDYIGDSNAGRVMAVVTDRPDGSNDTAVFAPTATISARST